MILNYQIFKGKMRKLRTLLLFFFIAISLLIYSENSSATIYTWAGGTSGTWTSASNWSPNTGYPGKTGTTDIAIINTSNTTISYTGNLTLSQLESTSYGVSGININFTGTTPTLAITSGLSFAQPSGFSVVLTFSGTGTATIGGTSTFLYGSSFTISSGTTVNFTSGSTLDWSATQGVITNNGTLKLTSTTLKFGSYTSFVSPGTIIANSTYFNLNATPAYITYAGTFVANSSTFDVQSGSYLKSTSTSSAFTATTSTFNLIGSGGAAYFYNNGNFRDHGSTYNLSGQSAYMQNYGSSSIMHLSGTTVNFSTSGGSNAQYINNSGTFTADSVSAINAATYQSYITNSGTFYAGTSGSACIITLSGQSASITNTSIFDLGSTSIIYPTAYSVSITNTSPGVFTLQSDANGSAAIAAFNSVSSCTGTFNVERYYQGNSTYDNTKKRWLGRNYRIISSPVNTGTIVNSNYIYGLNYIVGSTVGLTATANSSTNAFITGCTGGSTSAGNPSIYLYRESLTPSNATFTSGNFIGITNITSASAMYTSDGSTTTTIPAGNGVFFFFRGAASNWSTRTSYPYIAPENVTLTSTGNLNTQSVTVKDWYTPTSSNLAHTGSGGGTNVAIRGFNMAGNPYPCSIDWNTINSGGITATNINPAIYVLNPITNQYDAYKSTGASSGTGTGNATNIIASGQGFFVKTDTTGASLVFNETAKSATSQLTGRNLLMGTPVRDAIAQTLRLKLSIDSLNYDDIAIGFNSATSSKYNGLEDAIYIPASSAMEGLASISADSIPLAINYLPLPKQTPLTIRLDVEGRQTGLYTLQRTALDAIPQVYDIWLMDKYKKDSLDIKHNTTYVFDLDLTDYNSFGSHRFQLVIRQNPALAVHLLNFTATKASNGAQTVWTAENEQNYTNFTVERSTDGGVTFNVLGGFPSSGLGTYSFLDKAPPVAADMYRLKIEDLNGAISYSNAVTLMYANINNTASNISVYPNPASDVINLSINQNSSPSSLVTQTTGSTQTAGTQSFDIKIINITGAVIQTAASSQPKWQSNIGNLLPGTYIIQVINNNNKSVVGKGTFIKL
jgi:hypothetical protein